MDVLELAQIKDLASCNDIICSGREFQKEQGFVQWTEDYPNESTIQSDIHNQIGYSLKVDGKIAGYLCLHFSGEPAYEQIQGTWRTGEPYAVVHRMAFHKDFRGMGLADRAFRLIEEVCKQNHVGSIRVDTDFPNKRMQHILTKNGFVNCGIIIFQGSEKLAFDKLL